MTRHDPLQRFSSRFTPGGVARAATAALVVLATVAATTPGASRASLSGARGANAEGPLTQEVVRTGDPYARGYSDEDFPRVQEIAPGVYSYEQLRAAGDEMFTTVSLFVVTDEGVLVADGQGSAEETQRLIDTIAGITEQAISHVIVCSDHGDHTGGNVAFGDAPMFLAHPTSVATLQAAAESQIERDGSTDIVVPDAIAAEPITSIELGGREIQLLFLGRAHTGGDLHVYLPGEKVLFMSEAYLNRIFPAMRSAHPSEWVAALEAAQALDVDMYVPGHGFVDSPEILTEELETYRLAMVQVIGEAQRLHAAGVGVEEAIEQADFGDLETWTLRDSQGPTAIRRVYMELNGELGR